MLTLSLSLALVLTDVPPPSKECSTAADCVVTTFNGCCGSCCAPDTQVMSMARLRREQGRCALVECDAPNCAAVRW